MGDERLPSGFVTFVFTDIEGSTRMFQRLGDRYRSVLDEHRRLLRSAFTAHGGVELGTEGDAFFVVFASPADAVLACVEAQRALGTHAWPEDAVIRVRIGVHCGEAEPIDGDYVSMVVHQAAHVASTGHGGQIVVSDATRRAVEQSLPPGVSFTRLGEYRLKDFDDAQVLHQVSHPELPSFFPALKVLPAEGHNLPLPRTSFLGRDAEVAELATLVHATPLVTITGPGGVGKTRLALEVGRTVLPSFPEGVWLVELASVTDRNSIPFALASVLGVREDAGRPLEDTILDALRSRRLLVVLDNCEHLVEGVAAIVDRLSARVSDLRILTTSREPLGVEGERIWAAGPFDVDEAERLFTERAAAARRDFVATDEVAAISAALDGLPLAIELAAARVRVLTPAQILAKLTSRLALLGPLRATIDWSHDLLDPGEQMLFRRLACFRGGCTFETAETVVGAEVDIVQSLVDKSLVVSNGGRLSMLETIREFASERLDAAGESDEMAAAHADYFASIAPGLGRRTGTPTVRRSTGSRPTTTTSTAALDWALEHDAWDLFERFVEGLWYPWVRAGLTSDGYQRARLALDRSPDPSPRLVTLVGELARFTGDFEACVEMKRRAIAGFEAAGAPLGDVAAAHTDVAEALIALGRFADARADAKRGLALREACADDYGIAHARAALVQLELALGDNATAAALAELSIPVFRDAGSRSDLAWELLRAATAYSRLGNEARARDRLREGLRVGVDIGEAAVLVAVAEQAAAVSARAGEDDAALRLFGASRALRRATGWVFATDDAAIAVSGPRVPRERQEALLAEGASATLDTALEWVRATL